MAGAPLRRAVYEALDEHEEEIFSRLASGDFVTRICSELLAEPYEEQGRGEPNSGYFYEWLDEDPDRRARYTRVRKDAGADAMAEESVTSLDDALEGERRPTSAEAQLIKAKSSKLSWLAGKLNRERYGDGPGVQVNVGNVQDLHLQALQQGGSMDKAREAGHLPPRDTEALPDDEDPELIEGDYEEIDTEEAEKAAKRAKLGELEQDQPDSDAA